MHIPTRKAATMEGNIKIREEDGRREVLDPVRRRWVALTPEEWVRQNVVALLHGRYGYPFETMQVEHTIALNGMSRRCDIVVNDADCRPTMIVECKKADVAITQTVCDQACRYNLALRVPYLMLTNGHRTVVLAVDAEAGTLKPLSDIPRWEGVKKS